MTPILPALLFLLSGLVLGAFCSWIITRLRFQTSHLSKAELDEQYVGKSIFQNIENQLDICQKQLRQKEDVCIMLEKKLSEKDRDLLYMEEKIASWQKELESLRSRAHTEFENIANRILEEKSRKFTNQNEKKLNDLLQPLRENIRDFGKDIEQRFSDEAKDKVSLKKEIEQLRELNTQLSSDAQLLASALKGDSKVQGDWGEMQLELLLEKAGLSRNLHYSVQSSFKDEQGRDKRPDFVINLPENKHLVVDSKVSLKAYERYFSAKDEKQRKRFLKAHLESLRQHIRDLSNKNYQNLYQINTPDYLILFVPIEPAFNAAIREDSRIFLDALDRNIVLVTTSTLLATMRTVSYIWRQEKQKKNVLEIARQSGMLYDKFVGFVADLKEVGQRIDAAHNAWNGAMNKLSDSKKYGDTLIGRAERIKKLGAKAAKQLPAELLQDDPMNTDSNGLEISE